VKSITAHFGILETNAQQKKFMLSARKDNMLPTVRKLTVKHSNLTRINEKKGSHVYGYPFSLSL